MEKSRFIIANITWNSHGWREPYSNEKAGHKLVRTGPGHESLNFKFDKEGRDDEKHVFGYVQLSGYPRRFEEPGVIFFFTKNLDGGRNEIVGVYGNAEIVKPQISVKREESGSGSVSASIKADKEKSILFPKYLDAGKYKDPGWKRMVGRFGLRYISQELAVEMITDEIREAKKSVGITKKELDKLRSISELITKKRYPSSTSELERLENKQTKAFFDGDEVRSQDTSPKTKQLITTIRARNSKAVKNLKTLYNNQCQISGKKYTFKKIDGGYYSEAHHLIPLGKGGADHACNIVILSPLIHRMMHYAKVDDLALKNIKNDKLSIRINGTEHTITWHPDHAKTVKKFSS